MTSFLIQLKRRTAPLRRAVRYRNRRPLSDACDPDDSVILASSGRSGSTFLAGLLNWDQQFRYLFEPLHPSWVKQFGNQPKQPYLPAGSDNAALLKDVSDAYSGALSNPWIDQYNPQRNPDRRLVKVIRGNLTLAGYTEKFPRSKCIFLLRNPLAQALSAVRGNWKLDPTSFGRQPEFRAKYPELVQHLNQCPSDPFLRAITFWCVENLIPLVELNFSKIKHLRYEDLVTNPQQQIAGLFEYIGKDFDQRVLDLVDVRSKTTRATDKGNPLTRWKTILSDEQQGQASQILQDFGLDSLYDDQGLPGSSIEQVQQALSGNKFVGSAPCVGASSSTSK